MPHFVIVSEVELYIFLFQSGALDHNLRETICEVPYVKRAKPRLLPEPCSHLMKIYPQIYTQKAKKYFQQNVKIDHCRKHRSLHSTFGIDVDIQWL